MKAREFEADLSRKVDNLGQLQTAVFDWPDLSGKRLFLVGMGSSHFAAGAIAHRLQMAGVNAFATLASLRDLPQLTSEDVVIAISATGQSVETLHLVERLGGRALFLTNHPQASVPTGCRVVAMNSLPETGGVASLTYQATLVALLRLEEQLTGSEVVTESLSRAAEATSWILDHREDWQATVTDFVTGVDGTQFVAPLERWTSAQQSALMIRECPRRRAEASEAGDWAHIDVYLTKNHDLQVVLFAGSPWQEQVLDWTTERNRRVLMIGGQAGRAHSFLEYPHEEDNLVALLTETTFAEVVAARLWRDQT